MKNAFAIVWIVAALLIACSSETPPLPRGGGTSTDARPSATTPATQLPTATPAETATPTQPVQPVTSEATPIAAPVSQPATETPPTAAPPQPTTTNPPTATVAPGSPSPTPTPTALPPRQTATSTSTSSTTVLRVTISEVPAVLPDYDRDDWKHWVDADGDCQDARNEVLIAESRTAVTFRTDRKCRVAAGEWLTPYGKVIVTDPSKLDVDHMVPLGNAHGSGASHWTDQRKERYANYLSDPQHLIAVTASANRSKGARGPEDWTPEDRTYWCQYAVDWITIKHHWHLYVTQREHDSLVEMLNTCANRPQLAVSHERLTNPTPVPGVEPAWPTPLPDFRTYSTCDAAQAAKAVAEASRSGWCRVHGTATGTGSCAKHER